MDNPQIIDDNFGGSTLNSEIKSYLAETAKWGYFLSIVGFIGIGFMVLAGLFMGSFMSTLGLGAAGMGLINPAIFTVIYLLMAALYFFPVLYLFKFSTKMKVALRSDNEAELTTSFQNLKSLYKFMGILTAIILGLYALIFVFGMIGGAML
ncbi:MAG: DUF5362 domain-containing protein [Saprospiraceae bacterium]|nr:DUF5362 domain-containing protein [Saprospiraceae bacterium]